MDMYTHIPGCVKFHDRVWLCVRALLETYPVISCRHSNGLCMRITKGILVVALRAASVSVSINAIYVNCKEFTYKKKTCIVSNLVVIIITTNSGVLFDICGCYYVP